VNLFAYVDGGRIVTESWFSRSSKVRAGIIEVFDAATGEKFLSGTTDDAGNFAFDIPPAARAKKADLRITLKAGEGHANQTTIKAEEYLSAPAAPSIPAAPAPAPAGPGSDATPAGGSASGQAASGEDAATPAPAPSSPPTASPVPSAVPASAGPDPRLLAAMDAMLDARLAPIKSMLAESQDPAPSMTEIIGGIGWIFGLVGMAAYFKGRRG
jgi:nickel transport protein